MREGWMRPSAINLFSAIRATSRRIVSKALTITTPGVSSMMTSTPVAFSKARMLRPSRPMMRPFHFVVGDAHRAGGGLAGMRGGVALEAGEEDFPRLLLADFGGPFLVAEDDLSGLLLQLRVEEFQQPLGGLLFAQPAQFMQGLPLQVEELGEFLLAAVGILNFLGQFALRALDDLLLLAKLFGLFLQGVLAFVQEPLAFVEFAPQTAQLLFALGLGLDASVP